jgi:hypothetical protein
MSDALARWHAELSRRRRTDRCACSLCLPYPNAAAAERWQPGDPVPEGWQLEEGWGLTRKWGT